MAEKKQRLKEEQLCKPYLNEIEVWQRASRIHAEKAIEQYQRFTENLEAFHLERSRNAAVLDNLSDGVIVFDENNEIILWNRQVAALFGLSASQAVGQDFFILMEMIAPDLVLWLNRLRQYGEQRTIQAEHKIHFADRRLLAKVSVVVLEEHVHWVLLLEDMTQLFELQQQLLVEKQLLEQRVRERTAELEAEMRRKAQAQQELERMVRTDLLTGLYNRYGFQVMLNETMEAVRGTDEPFVVFFVDLDGFKAVNDALGHHAGDRVLRTVAERIRRVVRSDDVVARLAGDEFAILIRGVESEPTVKKIARNLVEAIREDIPVDDQGNTARVSASIGIYMHMPGEYDPSRVLSMADHAMYEAKRRGKNRFVIFEEDMWSDLRATQSLSVQLERALDNGEFKVFLQPVCTPEGEVVSAEALARWQNGDEWISPGVFVPLLEKRGLIQRLTHQILEQVAMFLHQHPQMVCISVNLSIQQFYEEGFIDRVRELHERYDLNGRLGFEITESLLNSDLRRVQGQLETLRELGCRISIDDFGTGYSSFAYIRDFPADVLKIDRSFVTRIERSERDVNLLSGMVALAHEMELKVVVEGVETRSQIRQLREHMQSGWYVQGFVFFRPFPMERWFDRVGENLFCKL